ncbi:MAG TPA: alpha/beta hydrolase [Solirubrobacteraceae bacterium]|nr:alpha/beta hydrolase [Solirubrobacteraceae bacterium]
MQESREARILDTGETTIRVRCAGSGPGVLLLHGFPETSLMWRDIAPLLAERFTVVCADLRGYGGSGCPASSADHAPYSKRALARDMVAVMSSLGFERFSVAGHDRGGRVAYRLALDHPQRIERLAVLDIVPVDVAWDRADDRLALGFWPWSLLAQAEPLPERLVGAAPEAVIDTALSPEWGTPASTFAAEVRAAYLAQLQDPMHLHAICEEYRAAASIDRQHDRADRESGRRITCPVLAMWSAGGPLDSWYEDIGGPVAVWRELATDISGRAVDGGHFFPEEHPDDTAGALLEFFGSARP